MWLFASDYDGTFSRNWKVPQDNIRAVDRWRQAGHLFGLVTGRDINMTRTVVKEFSIPFDFLVCNNGGTVWDSQGNAKIRHTISQQGVAVLLQFLQAEGCVYAVLSTGAQRHYLEELGSGPAREVDGFYTGILDAAHATQLTEVVQADLRFGGVEEAAVQAAKLNRMFPDVLCALQNGDCVDVVPAGINKGHGIAELVQQWDILPERIFTIGDGQNDVEMLAKYEGYSVQGASIEARTQARAVVPRVATLLDCLLDGTPLPEEA